MEFTPRKKAVNLHAMKIFIKASPRWIAILAVVCLCIATFVSCKKQEAPPPVSTIKLKIGYIPILDCSQVYVASQLGYFAENGLDVELVPLAGGPAIIQALVSDAIDVGFANLTTIVFYEQASPRLNRLAGGTRMNKNHSEAGLVVSADSGIARIAALKGRTIAVNSRRNIVDLAVLRAVKVSGLSANDIKLVELPFKDMEAAVRAKRIDAATLPEPILSSAMKTTGLRNLGDHFAIAFGEVYSTGYFSAPKSSKMTPEMIKKFDAAILKATSNLGNPTEKTYEAISTVTKLPAEVLKLSGKPEFVVSVPETAFEQMKTWMEEERLLENK
jgi:NitT/TauT family transport system substrate-binding protein